MLKLLDYRTKSKGLPDLLPYAALIAPGVILNKDGSFLAGWEIRGQDTASSTESDLALVSSRFNNAVKLLGSGWMLHMDAIRSSHKAYSQIVYRVWSAGSGPKPHGTGVPALYRG